MPTSSSSSTPSPRLRPPRVGTPSSPPTPRAASPTKAYPHVTKRREDDLERSLRNSQRESDALERALVRCAISREREKAEELHEAAAAFEAERGVKHTTEQARLEALADSQESCARLQEFSRLLRDTSRAVGDQSVTDAIHRHQAAMEEREVELRREGQLALEQAVAAVRTQMEDVLYETVAKHEQCRIERDDARAACVERDKAMAELGEELAERRQVMARLHAAMTSSARRAAGPETFMAIDPTSLRVEEQYQREKRAEEDRLALLAIEQMREQGPQTPAPPSQQQQTQQFQQQQQQQQQAGPSRPQALPAPSPRSLATDGTVVGSSWVASANGAGDSDWHRLQRLTQAAESAPAVGLAATAGGAHPAGPPASAAADSQAAAPAGGTQVLTAEEAEKVARVAARELEEKVAGALVPMLKEKLAAAKEKEIATAKEHKAAIEELEKQLAATRNELSVRFTVVRAELRGAEAQLTTHAGVHEVLSRTLAQLTDAEGRALEAERAIGEHKGAARAAEVRLAEERAEKETALERADEERDARTAAEDRAAAAAQRMRLEVESSAATSRAAIESADELVASTNAGALAVSEAVDAVHRWVDGVLLHGASNLASAHEAVEATVRGGCASPSLRSAHSALYALQTRLGYLCEEVLRLRSSQATSEEAAARAQADSAALAAKVGRASARHSRLEERVAAAEERTRAAESVAEARATEVATSALAVREIAKELAEARRSLEPPRQLAYSVAVQLSEALRRSGCIEADAPMLVSQSSDPSAWEWEKLAGCLTGLASHVSYYWEAHQRELVKAKGQVEAARKAAIDKDEMLTRAAAVATGLRRASAVAAVAEHRGPGPRAFLKARAGLRASDLGAACKAWDASGSGSGSSPGNFGMAGISNTLAKSPKEKEAKGSARRPRSATASSSEGDVDS